MNRILLSALLAVVSLVLGGVSPAGAAAGDTVHVQDGALRGTVTAGGREFLGVPFAAPPTGQLRFAAPAPVTPWSGTRSADHTEPWCPQSAPFVGPVVPSLEDCLYLDVYTPPAARSKNLPVMVWIYGGAYVLGGSSQYQLRKMVAAGEVIGVALSYRVGPFGFLAAPGLSGNFGLMDQQAALRWVQRNIGAFGGNPRDVTLFGESAGGNSVCQQLASPLSRGLFQKAIVQSGGCGTRTLDGQTKADADRTGIEYATSLGCRTAATRIACLRGKSQIELLNTPLAGFNSMKVHFRPVVDGTVVTGSTGDAFAAGRQAKVPVMIGGNLDEGTLFVMMFQHLAKLRVATAAEYRAVLADLFGDDAARIAAEYPVSRYGSPDQALASVYTDGLFACSTATAMRDLARTAPAAYGYEFREQDTPTSGLDPLLPLGAHHAAELAYLGLPAIDGNLTGSQKALSDRMIRDWTTFARTGRPGAGWPSADTGKLLTLTAATVGTDDQAAVASSHRCGFWDSLG